MDLLTRFSEFAGTGSRLDGKDKQVSIWRLKVRMMIMQIQSGGCSCFVQKVAADR